MNLYFTSEIRDRFVQYANGSENVLRSNIQLHRSIRNKKRKISRPRLRLQRNVERFITCMQSYRVPHNPLILFGDVLVAVVDVVCLSSLMISISDAGTPPSLVHFKLKISNYT